MTTVIVNTHTGAVGHYLNYPFNSYCEIGGVYFGAGPGGLYQLDVGDNDSGTLIDAGLSTGLMNFKEPLQKRVDNAYMTLRTAGTLALTVTADDGARQAGVTLGLPNYGTPGFIQRRVAIPKGLRGKSWQFELNNTDGAAFDFGHLGITLTPSARRI